MVDPAERLDGEPPAAPTGGRPARPGRWVMLAALLSIVIVIADVGLVLNGRPSGTSTPTIDRPSPPPAASTPASIALVDGRGALATVDASGQATVVSSERGTTYGFPAWSPDGSRVAAVAYSATDTSIAVFPIAGGAAGSGPQPTPVVIYRSAAVPPFYLYWSPDGRRVTFLATEADGISLRIAPADGSAPLDGSGPGSVIRRGAPLYFDWVGADRLLLHVGTGTDAFLGEVGLDGASAAPDLAGSGDFRAAAVGADGRYVTFVRGRAPSAELVVAARDGSTEHATPVFGPAAAVFDPGGAIVASIAPDQPGAAPLGFPLGPLRLIDAGSGAVRTLLDGSVVGFFWSPDGRTIAALRLQGGSGSTVAELPIVEAAALAGARSAALAGPHPAGLAAASPAATFTPPPDAELHLLFLDAGDGTIRSDRVVRPTTHFVNEFLLYFDQYALSHRLWSPDSRSLLLPEVDDSGDSRLVSLQVDGSDGPRPLDGVSGFWSP